jgi:hypothetical protein
MSRYYHTNSSTRLYEIYFRNVEGVPLLRYLQASSEEEARAKFLSSIKEVENIFYVLPTSVDIFED